MLKASDLKEIVVIQQENSTTQEPISVFAKVQPLFNRRTVGYELSFAKQVQSANFYEFRIRYLPNLNTSCSLRWNDKDFNIIKVLEHSAQKKEMSIIAEEAI